MPLAGRRGAVRRPPGRLGGDAARQRAPPHREPGPRPGALPAAARRDRIHEVSVRMSDLLKNYLGGRWVAGSGAGTALFDPVLGDEPCAWTRPGWTCAPASPSPARWRRRAACDDLPRARRDAGRRREGAAGRARRLLRHRHRQQRHGEERLGGGHRRRHLHALDLRQAGRESGRAPLPARRRSRAPGQRSLLFQSRHVLVPTRGLALFINAFNFPSWGLWEKAAPALLSGVPVVVKPATATAWLTQRMVRRRGRGRRAAARARCRWCAAARPA